MISLYAIKPGFQRLLRPIARCLHSRGVSANQVTLAALLLSLAAGGALCWAPPPAALLLLPPVLLLRMALNALDGMLAREFQRPTPLGAILNETGDVLADAGLYLPLILIPGVSAAAVVALVLLALLSEFCGVLGVQVGASRRYDGPLGKSDRALLLGGIALVLGLGAPGGGGLTALLWVANGLLALTCFNRLGGALRELKLCP
ncbi:MAG: CDP-alcohol phosphatidyltransferase family protein [Candidatus Competibacteraceae bacterium]|nr:CDP-alcohol phosphatidyltransferase family protein [Candidatus Competibacteraceae bacterium]MBK8898594.1 CDP-alcohol phosphatidyltransferase family protein [Candidatus Competibacteraceae bacterium]